MQFKNFALYDKTAAQSVFTVPCSLMKLDGRYAGSGNEFLQIFDKATAATANNVPIASFPLTAAGPLPSVFETMGALSLLLGLSIGISTTNEKYTASASEFDIFGGIALMELPVTETAVGPTDISGSSGLLDVWTPATSPTPKLSRIVYTNVAAAHSKRWLCIVTTTTGDGAASVLQLIPMFNSSFDTAGVETVTNIAAANLSFGGGLQVQGRALDTTIPLAFCNGCLIFVTDTTNPATYAHIGALNIVTGEADIVTAYYKTT